MGYLDCTMSSTSSNYKSIHDNRFHGDEDFDPRSDLSQGRGDDAEHPAVIPMYTRAYAFGPKVNPLLNASPFHSCETWLLPNARTLHMPRYQGDPLGDARNDGQVPKYKDEGARREEPEKGYRTRTSGPSRKPGHPAPARISGAHHRRDPKLNHISPDIRPEARTSGSSRAAGHPAPQPGHPTLPIQRLQKFAPPARTSGPQPGHPAPPEAPDIRPVARTSGSVCLRTVKGRSPCTPLTP